MRKIIALFFVFFVGNSFFCNAQTLYDFENKEYYFCVYYSDLRSPPFRFSFYDGIFCMDIPELDNDKIEERESIKGTISGEYTITNENGFVFMTVSDKKFLILYDRAVACILIDCENNDLFFGLNKNSIYVNDDEGIHRTFIGILETYNKVSSFLTETIRGRTIRYDGSRIKYSYELVKPWVEGKDDYGIGEWMETELVTHVCGVIFFNGYIDPNHPDLYYDNSRIKELHITSEQNTWSFGLDDSPHPQILTLPDSFNGRLRFTIKDIYKGNKYADTCLAGIYFLRIKGQ